MYVCKYVCICEDVSASVSVYIQCVSTVHSSLNITQLSWALEPLDAILIIALG